MIHLTKIEIEVSRTADGQANYVQIRSPGADPVNIVLIADEITVYDARRPQEPPRKSVRRK